MRIERLEYQSCWLRDAGKVDPSNRLVAGTLERRWNDALEELKTAQGELQQSRQQQGLELTEEQKTQMRALLKTCPSSGKARRPGPGSQRMLRLSSDITGKSGARNEKPCCTVGKVARWKICRSTSLPAPEKVRYPEAMVSRV